MFGRKKKTYDENGNRDWEADRKDGQVYVHKIPEFFLNDYYHYLIFMTEGGEVSSFLHYWCDDSFGTPIGMNHHPISKWEKFNEKYAKKGTRHKEVNVTKRTMLQVIFFEKIRTT